MIGHDGAGGRPLVGRDGERLAIDRFISQVQLGSQGLLLSGPAGIGKTALWHAARERAREAGFRVVACRPTGVEAGLSFAALVDLFGELTDEAAALPEAQRAAVDAAFLRSSAAERPSPLGVSLGVLGIVRAAVAAGPPLLIAVDDVQWLDEPSAQVLEFAVRRVETETVGVLVAQRDPPGTHRAAALFTALPRERRTRLALGPMSPDDIGRLVAVDIGLELRRPAIVRLHELSGGNAFFALELARAMVESGHLELDADQPIHLPETLDELVRARIQNLSPASMAVALRAASLAQPSVAVLARAVGDEPLHEGLEGAVEAEVLEVDETNVRFAHPLLAAAVYEQAPLATRREVHRALASVVDDPEERARQLASAATGPDAEVAEALDEAARTAATRGAAVAAAGLARRAAELTPPELRAERRRRLRSAADHHLAAGDAPRARAVLESLLADATNEERGAILVRIGQILLFIGDRLVARDLFLEALTLVPARSELRVRVEMGLAAIHHLTLLDWASGADHIEHAYRLAVELGDPRLLFETIAHYITWRFDLGDGLRRDLVAQAEGLEAHAGGLPAVETPRHQFAKVLLAARQLGEARALQDVLIAEARRVGDWNSLPWLHLVSAWLEVTSGDWHAAESHILECRMTGAQSGQRASAAYALTVEARLHALQGDEAACRAAARQALAEAHWMHLGPEPLEIAFTLAILELSMGDPAAAYGHLERFLPVGDPRRAEPARQYDWVTLAVEVLVGTGRLEEAEAILSPFEESASDPSRPWALGDALFARAMLLQARQDLDRASEAAGRAVGLFDAQGIPFEAARARLLHSDIRRRMRQRGAARDAAAEAHAAFQRLGAALWAERARVAMSRVEGRRPPGAELTETERRVAGLVAEGRTNREIADALFMSVHTVEAHLTRIYRTVGVESRTELARWITERVD